MKNKKMVGILLIIIGLLVICAVIYFLFFNKKKAPEAPEIKAVEPKVIVITPPEEKKKDEIAIVEEVPAQTKEEISIGSLASSFAERFGSYSNQSNFNNIKDLEMFMTDNMKIWAAKFIAEQQQKSAGSPSYNGIITKTITFNIDSTDEAGGTAKVTVQTRRKELKNDDTAAALEYNQPIIITFKKVDGQWKVDSAYWQ